MPQEAAAFNVALLKVDKDKLKYITPITVLDIFENAKSTNFHPNGLFSTEIFGRVGDDDRDTRFSYIDLKTKILHPVIYFRLERLKRLYIGILSGKEYARWDEELKDFFPDTELTGNTGYEFFLSRWDELIIPTGNSAVRNQRIELINKYKERSIATSVMVMPAGLRDAEIDSLGRTIENEINTHYRRLVGISNTIGKTSKSDVSILDTARYAQQLTFNEIYLSIETILTGKKGFLQRKWGSRAIFDGTRNVISAMEISNPDLDDDAYPDANDTVMGLWQASRAALPITIQALHNGILNDVFGSVEGGVKLIDVKTLELEYVNISPQTYDRWTTSEGLEKVIASQGMMDLRAKPIHVEGRYLALVYRPKNKKVFKIFTDIKEMPEWASMSDVYPITYEELVYLSNYRHWNELKVINTRYPVLGEGSTYPSNLFVKTTVKSDRRVELDDYWEEMSGEDAVAISYPIVDSEVYVDSMMVHPTRLAGLTADFDGDMMSGNVLYTRESIKAVNDFLNSREAYIDPAGGLKASAATDTVSLTLYNISG